MIFAQGNLNFDNSVVQSFQALAFTHLWDSVLSLAAFKTESVPAHTIIVTNVSSTATAYIGAMDGNGLGSLVTYGYPLLPGQQIQFETSASQLGVTGAPDAPGTVSFLIVTK